MMGSGKTANGAMVGYARLSSVGQSREVRRAKLAQCDKLFEEERSGITSTYPNSPRA